MPTYVFKCPFCHKQNPVLRSFAEAAALEVLPISLDGLPMPADAWADDSGGEGSGR